MPIAHSKVTAQGQISVPAEVRRKLGIGPGSILEWAEEGDAVLVRKAGCFSSEDVHNAVFAKGKPVPKKLDEFDSGMRRYLKNKYARR
jgi:AbrB family looped-hinge helix DNA binding protein